MEFLHNLGLRRRLPTFIVNLHANKVMLHKQLLHGVLIDSLCLYSKSLRGKSTTYMNSRLFYIYLQFFTSLQVKSMNVEFSNKPFAV